MKPRFTLFQKILTTLFVMLEGAVIAGDVMELFWLHRHNNDYYYWVNLVLCLFLLLVFLALIINPKAGVNAEEADSPETLLPQLSASRTYMCFIAVDIAAIFAFVMFFSKFFENPALIVILGGILLFIIGAIKYLYDCKKIGFEEIEYEDDDEEEKPEKPAAEAVKEKPKQTEEKKDAAPQTQEAKPEEKPSKQKEEPKEQPKEEAKQEPKEEPKSEPSEPKEESKEEPKAEEKAEEKPADAPKTAPQQNKPAPKNTSVQKKSYPAKKKGGKKKKNKK